MRLYVAIKTISLSPYRFDPQLRVLLKGLFEKKEMFLGSVKQLRNMFESSSQVSKEKKKILKKKTNV